ncbi:patatin-like phospholipase family protein [Janthinobacterium sp. 17J80-10]|uniref:patatin-like phospholipase family protein n=1 Tax=Janthinobacterium sp. 17J80-10 TaxID=2497863 RepID=UPI00100567F8|nr:patatin-like phospholipase family protein [Janthinobacterium sp. 17J80-10]QAU35923.1 patatin-like phospholipase family protein [Janthinobacterium sp. 17J80-10]
MKASNDINPHQHRIALVLQGGGALGAYQAGVYQALHEHGLTPDWVVGTSIGAINAAIIAGNKRGNCLTRLKEFWDRVSHGDAFDMSKVSDPARQFNIRMSTLDTVVRGVPGFFSPRGLHPFPLGMPVDPEEASFYDTAPLVNTLRELVDFDYLNKADGMRLTVEAVKVSCGRRAVFDNSRQAIGPEHILASGALPPGFPGVRIDGELYWDGGLFSNTPLETVLDDEPRIDTLCFMVDLWSASGDEPTTIDEVATRQKDVMYASRSKNHIEHYLELHHLRSLVRKLHAELPDACQKRTAYALEAVGRDSTIHIVRLAYSGRDWHMASKDINFSRGSIEWRWEQGYNDAMRAIHHRGWTSFVPAETGIVVHELVPDQANAVDIK